MSKKRNFIAARVNDMMKAFILQYCEETQRNESDCIRHGLQLLMSTYLEGERVAAAIGLKDRINTKKKFVKQKRASSLPLKRVTS